MRKKMTKLLSYALAGVVTLTSAVAAPLGALAAETAEPEILFYRDFEDYTGGDPIDQTENANAYGTWGVCGTSTWDKYTKAESLDGTGFYVNTSAYSSNHAAFPDMADGTLYVAFDEIPGGEPKETSVYFKSGTPNFAFSYKPGVSWTALDRNWGYDQTTAMLGQGKNHRIELIIDPATGDAKRYINSTYIGTKNIGITTGLTEMLLRFSATSVVDNLAIVYYPENVISQTFSLAKVEADEKTDVFRVFLKSDATDSDGKGTSAKSSISAPYGITLKTTSATETEYVLSADTFSVEGMNVTNVTKGIRSGEYIVEVDGDIEPLKTYTVSAKADIIDILGATLNPDAASKSVTVAERLGATASVSDGTAILTFNDDIINPSEYSKGVIVKNIYTGETGSATLTEVASNQASISGYEFFAGDEYEVTLPDTLRGKKGNSLGINTVIFNLAATNSLKKLSLVDIQGYKADLSEINTVALESIDFEFTPDVTASEKTITITDENGTAFTDYTAVPAGNKTSLKLNKILAPDKTYTVSISGLAKAYEITLTTESAKFERVGVQFLDKNDAVLESINEGDTVKVKMSVVNSTDEEKTFLAAASMFAGLEMTGFAHEEVTMKPVSEGGTGIYTKTFTFNVSKTAGGVKLNSYMWSVNNGQFAPVTAFESFE